MRKPHATDVQPPTDVCRQSHAQFPQAPVNEERKFDMSCEKLQKELRGERERERERERKKT